MRVIIEIKEDSNRFDVITHRGRYLGTVFLDRDQIWESWPNVRQSENMSENYQKFRYLSNAIAHIVAARKKAAK